VAFWVDQWALPGTNLSEGFGRRSKNVDRQDRCNGASTSLNRVLLLGLSLTVTIQREPLARLSAARVC
jgi:hypothetical protein